MVKVGHIGVIHPIPLPKVVIIIHWYLTHSFPRPLVNLEDVDPQPGDDVAAMPGCLGFGIVSVHFGGMFPAQLP